jgi:PAS domain S-box-containing protein
VKSGILDLRTVRVSSGPWPTDSRARAVLLGLLVGAAYYASAQVSLVLLFPGSPLSVIWPPNAIVLAALLLSSTRLWWVLLLAVLPAHLIVLWQTGGLTWTAPGLYLTNCMEALLGAVAVRRFANGPPWLSNLRQMAVYIAGAAVAAPFLTSFLDTGVIVLTQWGASRAYWLLFTERFVSNTLTYLTVTPVLLVGISAGWRWLRVARPWRRFEATMLAASVVGLGALIFRTPHPQARGLPDVLFVLAPVLFWAALRFGVGTTSAALLGITLLSASWSGESGPFSAQTPAMQILMLQLFLIVIALPSVLLAAVIQERRQAAHALRASEERYRNLVESQTEMVCRYLPDGTLTYVNQAFCQSYQQPREELLGRRFIELADSGTREHHLAHLADLLTHPRTTIDEHTVTRPDGGIGWQQWVDHPVCDADGRVVEFQSIGRDVTDRKRAELALKESEERFRTMADTAPVMIWMADPEGQVTLVNAARLAFTGRPPEHELDTAWQAGIHPDDRPRCLETYQKSLQARESFTITYRLRQFDGSYRWVLDTGVPRMAPGGSYLGHIGSTIDITEQKRAEDILRQLTSRLLQLQDEERRRLARELHDGTAQTIVGVSLNLTRLQELVHQSSALTDEAGRLLDDSQALVEQALRELRTKSYLLHPPQLEAAGLVPTVQWYLRGYSQRCGIDVELVAPSDFGRLPTDAEQAFFRVLQEALANVQRHANSARARVVLGRARRVARLIVKDFGGGMGGDALSAVQETSDDISHLGVGIPGMRERLRQLGGQLHIRSGPTGTTIVATISIEEEASR